MRKMMGLSTFFKTLWVMVAIVAFGVVLPMSSPMAMEKWWPSRYGADDELGTLNEITAANIVAASKLVGNGQIYEMGTDYSRENPGFPPRYWETTCLAHRTLEPFGSNKFVWLEEEFSGCPGVGTQIDSLSHVAIEYAPGDLRFYNGKKLSEVLAGNALLKRWGMDEIPQIVTRGVLADMVAFKGRELEVGEPITAEDIKACLKKQGVDVNKGDALLIRTGWMRWFKEDPKKFMSGEPGITVDVIEWAYEKHLSSIGVDQWSSEVVPMVNKDEKWPVHCKAIAEYGFTWFQDIFLDELAADKVYEFMFVCTHPRIAGSTQGIGNPIAIGNGPKVKKAVTLGPKPAGKKWWPSRYGAEDELGTLNELTSERVQASSKLVKQGKMFDMGTRYAQENPGFPPRYWHNTTLAHRLMEPLGSNKFTWLEEQFTGCPGVGTQTDNPAHVGIEYEPGDIRFYNGWKLSEVLSGMALAEKFQQWPAIVTRGVLVDVEAFKGRELKAGEAITAQDITACLEKQGVTVKPGDALLVRTGWMRWFDKDPKKFISGEPGITVDVIDWAYDHRLSFIAVDQWSSEVVPMVNKDEKWPVHCKAICEYGFTWGQDFYMEDLAKDCSEDGVYEFMFVNACPKIIGITQGISAPIALK